MKNIALNGKEFDQVILDELMRTHEKSQDRNLTAEEFEDLYNKAEKVYDKFGHIGLRIGEQTIYLPCTGHISGLDNATLYHAGCVCVWLQSKPKADVMTECSIPRAEMAVIDDKGYIIYPCCEADKAMCFFAY